MICWRKFLPLLTALASASTDGVRVTLLSRDEKDEMMEFMESFTDGIDPNSLFVRADEKLGELLAIEEAKCDLDTCNDIETKRGDLQKKVEAYQEEVKQYDAAEAAFVKKTRDFLALQKTHKDSLLAGYAKIKQGYVMLANAYGGTGTVPAGASPSPAPLPLPPPPAPDPEPPSPEPSPDDEEEDEEEDDGGGGQTGQFGSDAKEACDPPQPGCSQNEEGFCISDSDGESCDDDANNLGGGSTS